MNTLQPQVESYLQELSLLRKASTENRARQILMEALPHFCHDNPRAGVLAYLLGRRQAGNDPRTLENKRIRVAAFYRHLGVKLEIPKFKFVQRKPEIYTQPELDAIFGEATGRDFWLYRTLLMAGLRMQEGMFLEYDNLLDGGIEIKAHGDWQPKDWEERIIRVPKFLTDSLRQLPRVQDSNLVFPTARGGANFHMLRTLVRTAKRAGVAHAFLHKFRANFCTTLLRAGVALPDVMNQMGHSSVKSTMRYMALLGGNDLQSKIESIWQ